jgi:hypothetical protein
MVCPIKKGGGRFVTLQVPQKLPELTAEKHSAPVEMGD